jgi:hypothetical protein
MKPKHLCSVLLLLSLSMNVIGQPVRKVTVLQTLSPLLNTIRPNDIAFNNIDGQLVGYSFLTNANQRAIGLLSLSAAGATQFQKTYIYSPNPALTFEIIKIYPNYWPPANRNIYVLAGLRTTMNSTKFMPVILVLDYNTGNIVATHYLNISVPEPVFGPADFDVFISANPPTQSRIRILCIAGSNTWTPPNVRGPLYLIDFNPGTGAYTNTKISNLANPSMYYDLSTLNFVKGYHFYEPTMLEDLSFYGVEINDFTTNIGRGIVYSRDFSSNVTCNAYTLNGRTTRHMHVNCPEQLIPTLALANDQDQLFMEGYNNYFTVQWTRTYQKNFPFRFQLIGHPHYAKTIETTTPDYFLAQYRIPGEPQSGYSFLRYDYTTGNLQQTYSYDLNVTDFGTGGSNDSHQAVCFINDYTRMYYFAGASYETLDPFQYFYLIENDATVDQTVCVQTQTFNNEHIPYTKERVDLTFTNATPGNATPITFTEVNMPVQIETICMDNDSRTASPASPQKNAAKPNAGTLQSIITNAMMPKAEATIVKTPSRITIAQNGSNLVVTAAGKKIKQYNIYNAAGQLITRFSGNAQESMYVSLHEKPAATGMLVLQAIFDDGSSETKKFLMDQ